MSIKRWVSIVMGALGVAHALGLAHAQFFVLGPSEPSAEPRGDRYAFIATDEMTEAALGPVYGASKAMMLELDASERASFLSAYYDVLKELSVFDQVTLEETATRACGASPNLSDTGDFVCLANMTYVGVAKSAEGVPYVRLNEVIVENGMTAINPSLIRARLDTLAIARAKRHAELGRQHPPFPFVLFATHDADGNWVFSVVNVLTMRGNDPEGSTLTSQIAARRAADREARRQTAIDDAVKASISRQRVLAERFKRRLSGEQLRDWFSAYASLLDRNGKFPDGTDNPCGIMMVPPSAADQDCMNQRTIWLLNDRQSAVTFFGTREYEIAIEFEGEPSTEYRHMGSYLRLFFGLRDEPDQLASAVFVVRRNDGTVDFIPETLWTDAEIPGPEKMTIAPDLIVEGLGDLYDDLSENFGIDLALREGQRFNYVVGRDILYCRKETGDLLLVPSGFVTDLASVANWLRAIMLIDQSPKEFPGAILHDWLYAISRRENEDDHAYSDMLFREELRDAEAGWLTQRMFPLGTRIGGRGAVGRPSELRFATEESCRRGHGFQGVPQNAIVGRIGDGLPAGEKCTGFLDQYEELLAEVGQATPFDTSVIINEEPRARYFEDVVGNEDPEVSCPFAELPSD